MTDRVYQLKATIMGTKPPVWRRLLVREATTLLRLHDILQTAFGWQDCHLHEFRIDEVRYGTDDGEGWGPPPRNERQARLGTIAAAGMSFEYVYDFGDDWRHKIVVEKVLPAEKGATYPTCTGGRRAGPPEDCGGLWGYMDLIEAIRDPGHPDRESMLAWVGGRFDPAAFDRSEVARRLRFDHP
jgi:hypothetical protein